MKADVLFFTRKAGSDTASTKELWIYDLRTNTLARADLDIFWLGELAESLQGIGVAEEEPLR